MIDLAPAWKFSLAISNPVLLAAGGYSTAAATIGALVTLPTTLRARPGAPEPRMIEIPGGVLVRTGAANPGLAAAIREHRSAWAASQLPIIVAFAAQSIHDWVTMATQLNGVAGVYGIELHLNPTIDAPAAVASVRTVTELPLLVQLDLENANEIASASLAAGANALVIGRAPRAMKIVNGKTWFGRLFAPSVQPIVLRCVAEISAQRLGAPIIASGGIHSAKDAREFLAAGASAVEVDSAEWIEPGIAEEIARELAA